MLLTHTALSTESDVVQLNLVFPRNNTVYKPVYPFPIVFSVQNAAESWPYSPSFDWTLSTGKEDEYPRRIYSYGGYTHGPFYKANHLYMEEAPPPGQFLLINNALPLKLQISYGFAISPECGVIQDESNRNRSSTNAYSFFNTIYFEVSADGQEPDILTPNGSCATPLGTIGIAGSTGYNEINKLCPNLTIPAPAANPCSMKIDSAVVDQVAKAMITQSKCDMKKWPDPKFNETCYPARKSSSTRVNLAGFWVLLAPFVLFTL